jgi:hypothetical protein
MPRRYEPAGAVASRGVRHSIRHEGLAAAHGGTILQGDAARAARISAPGASRPAAPGLLIGGAGTPMRIQVMLLAEDESAHETTVASTIEVGADDLRWPEHLAERVAHRAQAGTRCLSAQLLPPPASEQPRFVPLAEVVPVVEP